MSFVRRRLVTRTEYASVAGVTAQNIGKLCRGRLAPACVRKKIDLDHDASVAYLATRGREPPPRPTLAAKNRPARRARAKPAPVDPDVEGDNPKPAHSPALPPECAGVDPEFYAQMTLDHIAREYGTMAEFIDVLNAVKIQAIIREKADRHRQVEGSVITRELVTVTFGGALERLFRRLVKPVPQTLMRKAYAMSRAGSTLLEAEAMARDLMTAEVKAIRDLIERTLREA